MRKNKPNVFDAQNITPVEFFKTHWQRAPYLFTDTTLDQSCLPNIEQLFELAAQEGVQSRIIYTTDEVGYQAIYDDPGAWEEVKPYKPTLLVSDIEKWYPSAIKLMSWFPFIKSWRFDDLMMSYAPKGASVGAHTDHYDVFLVQVQGTRQWSFDDLPLDQEHDLVEDSELSVIADFKAKHTIELKAGDVLYLPPEIPHHGISTSNDCVTCSIGLRAPSDAELMSSFIEILIESSTPKDRFKDDVKQIISNASIGKHEINYLRKHLLEMSQMEDDVLAELFGQVVTSYRLFDEAECFTSTVNSKTNALWKKSPFAVFAYHKTNESNASLIINGELYHTALITAQLICDQPTFAFEMIQTHSCRPSSDIKVIKELITAQIFIPA